MDKVIRSVKAQRLMEELNDLDGDWNTMTLLDDAIDYIAETKAEADNEIRRASALAKAGDILMVIGGMATLIGATGVDAPEPIGNYVMCVMGIFIALIGMFVKK